MLVALKITQYIRRDLCLVLLSLLVAHAAQAQSLEISSPSPIRTNDLVGTIAARDLGDARLTDHFYAFTGTPGDLLITVENRNLNGDIDVFTAVGLRPLMKFTIQAESSAQIAKSIYLRKREDLILRVEARTPNDDDGTYHIRFGGSFEPILSGDLTQDAESSKTESSAVASSAAEKKTRRVSSVGARLPEPTPSPTVEVAAAPTPEPTPSEAATESASEKSAEPPKETAKTTPSSSRPGNSSRRRSPRSKSSAAVKRPTQPAEAEVSEQPADKAGEPSGSETTATTTSRAKTGRTITQPAEPEPEPERGPRLVIETKNGILMDRYMNTVRRVTVENGQIVVVGKDGKIQRVQMSEVVRMSIQP